MCDLNYSLDNCNCGNNRHLYGYNFTATNIWAGVDFPNTWANTNLATFTTGDEGFTPISRFYEAMRTSFARIDQRIMTETTPPLSIPSVPEMITQALPDAIANYNQYCQNQQVINRQNLMANTMMLANSISAETPADATESLEKLNKYQSQQLFNLARVTCNMFNLLCSQGATPDQKLVNKMSDFQRTWWDPNASLTAKVTALNDLINQLWNNGENEAYKALKTQLRDIDLGQKLGNIIIAGNEAYNVLSNSRTASDAEKAEAAKRQEEYENIKKALIEDKKPEAPTESTAPAAEEGA